MRKGLFNLTAVAGTLGVLAMGALAAEKPKVSEVIIDGFQFQPAVIRVRVGNKVKFTNHDAAPHTVTPAEKSHFMGTGRMLKNEFKEVVFTVSGSQPYYCEIHPSMKGTVEVLP